jgi:hypothetical protein
MDSKIKVKENKKNQSVGASLLIPAPEPFFHLLAREFLVHETNRFTDETSLVSSVTDE